MAIELGMIKQAFRYRRNRVFRPGSVSPARAVEKGARGPRGISPVEIAGRLNVCGGR